MSWQVWVGQSGSYTCHHCSGETWHICTNDVACPYGDTWQTSEWENCANMEDKWTNKCLTRGRDCSIWNSATWPRRGLPCGIHVLASSFYLQKFYGVNEFQTLDLPLS
jgi:hypothetical protein